MHLFSINVVSVYTNFSCFFEFLIFLNIQKHSLNLVTIVNILGAVEIEIKYPEQIKYPSKRSFIFECHELIVWSSFVCIVTYVSLIWWSIMYRYRFGYWMYSVSIVKIASCNNSETLIQRENPIAISILWKNSLNFSTNTVQ